MKPMLSVLNGQRVDPPPIWLMRQAGRYLPEYREIRSGVSGFLEMCYSPDLAVEVTEQPIRRYGMDGAILFSDILVIPHALGRKVDFVAGEGPKLEPIDPAGLDAIAAHDITPTIAPVLETVRRLSARLPAETTLIGFAGAPWTVATYMVEGGSSREFAATKAWAYSDPKTFGRLISTLVEASTDYLSAQIKAGAQAVMLFDSWAGVLPEPLFRRWVIEPNAAIVSGLRTRHPETPIIGFPRGAGLGYVAYAEAVSPSALALDTTVPLDWAARAIPEGIALQGNLDPIMLRADRDVLAAEVRRIVDALSGRPHIFNLGHGVTPETPPENVALVVDTVRAHRGG
jgi:uroporphyrinogen decarboxylase